MENISQKSSSSSIQHGKQCSYFDLLSNRCFFLAACAGAMSQFVYSYMEPILAHTLEDLSLSQVEIGWFFMILPAAYIPSCIGLDYLPKRWDKRYILIMGSIFCGISLVFVGPSKYLAVTEETTLFTMILGQGLLGLFIPFGLVLSLPTMVEFANSNFPG